MVRVSPHAWLVARQVRQARRDFSYNETFTVHPAWEAKLFRYSTFTALKLAENGGDRWELQEGWVSCGLCDGGDVGL